MHCIMGDKFVQSAFAKQFGYSMHTEIGAFSTFSKYRVHTADTQA